MRVRAIARLVLTMLLFASSTTLAEPRARPRTITIDMQDAEVGNVLRLLAEVSGKNFVYGEGVQGKITLRLKNVPWQQALRVVLATKDLGVEEQGDVLYIAPAAKLAAEQQARLDRLAQHEQRAPLVTRVIPVNYADAEELAAQVRATLSPRGTVTVDRRTNTLIVRDVR